MVQMKAIADDENETRLMSQHTEEGCTHLTPVIRLPEHAAQAVVDALSEIVRTGHSQPDRWVIEGVIEQAQVFEEGYVFMLEPPFDGYFADRYLMDFYDVVQRDVCSRMHLHTGLRFVRMMTGTDTVIRVSMLRPPDVTPSPRWTGEPLETFQDTMPDEAGAVVKRYNAIVPPCSWVDLQIPRGCSHQFNALGPNAVIDSVHPEESIETLREGMSGYRMMAQTIFLAEERPPAAACVDPVADRAASEQHVHTHQIDGPPFAAA